MTALLERKSVSLNGHINGKELHSNDIFDRVTAINEKPSAKAEGLTIAKTSDSLRANVEDGDMNTPILPHSPNLYNSFGDNMKMEPHLRIPRSLHEDSKYFDSDPIYQAILNRFFFLAAFTEIEHNINGKIIILQPGQLCYSLRNLVKECGSKITLGNLRGAIRYFERVGFLTHNLTHEKTLITLNKSILYEKYQPIANTTSNTELTQSSHTNKECICSVCSVSVCICEKKEAMKMDVLQEHKKIRKSHPDGNFFEMSKSDLFTLSVQKKADWTRNEIDEVWEIFVEYSQPIRDVFKFCEGTIKNRRKMIAVKKLNEDKSQCKIMKKTSEPVATKTSTKPSMNTKEKTTESVTLGRPLANWKSQISQPK